MFNTILTLTLTSTYSTSAASASDVGVDVDLFTVFARHHAQIRWSKARIQRVQHKRMPLLYVTLLLLRRIDAREFKQLEGDKSGLEEELATVSTAVAQFYTSFHNALCCLATFVRDS